ncbi:MAG TPA: ThiF family adenylyltransferase [Polyangia bacterium]
MSGRFTLTILEEHYSLLLSAIFGRPGCEGAAYLVCGRAEVDGEIRLLVRDVAPVADADYLVRESHRMSIDSASYARIAKAAGASGDSVIFVHSHPEGISDFSPQDNREEPKLMQFLGARLPGPHGSVVIASEAAPRGRVWLGDAWTPIDKIVLVGPRLHVHAGGAQAPLPRFFERQVQAFGEGCQRLLAALHAGVVGAGGTGSAVAEQLQRLGIGKVSVFDGDVLEATNVTRVYGSTVADIGKNKATLLSDHLQRIGLGGETAAHSEFISREAVARRLRACDVVFGCTDKEAPRALLVQLALRYLIPVFDIGVAVDSRAGVIRSISGRVTTIFPGEACLFCRGRISAERIRLETLAPDERGRLVQQGYAPELPIADPAVLTFTTATAAQAVTELLHRLTGFMGAERQSSEVLLLFDRSEVKRNRERPGQGCLCTDRTLWGRGDAGNTFLGVVWGQ